MAQQNCAVRCVERETRMTSWRATHVCTGAHIAIGACEAARLCGAGHGGTSAVLALVSCAQLSSSRLECANSPCRASHPARRLLPPAACTLLSCRRNARPRASIRRLPAGQRPVPPSASRDSPGPSTLSPPRVQRALMLTAEAISFCGLRCRVQCTHPGLPPRSRLLGGLPIYPSHVAIRPMSDGREHHETGTLVTCPPPHPPHSPQVVASLDNRVVAWSLSGTQNDYWRVHSSLLLSEDQQISALNCMSGMYNHRSPPLTSHSL